MAETDCGDYLLLTTDRTTITIPTLPDEIPEAVWFGALTGGMDAELHAIDTTTLTLGTPTRGPDA
ncbi:hypothetical protein [Leifsonia shinshuensis]